MHDVVVHVLFCKDGVVVVGFGAGGACARGGSNGDGVLLVDGSVGGGSTQRRGGVNYRCGGGFPRDAGFNEGGQSPNDYRFGG